MKNKHSDPIRLAVLGLDSNFFCDAFVQWCGLFQMYPWVKPPFPRVEVTAASTLGVSEQEIEDNLDTGSRAFGEKHGLRIYATAEEVFEKERPDGVFVCGRPSRLPGIARMAVERGVHAFLQKPAGLDAGELLELAAEAERRGAVVCAGPTWRHDGAAQVSKARLRSEAVDVGKLCSLRVMYQHGMPGSKTWYSNDAEGGPEAWLAWYPIDLLHYFVESRITRLYATAHRGDGSAGRKNTIFNAACDFENGVCGSFDFYGNINYSYPRAEWELLMERGMIRNVQRHDIEIYGKGQEQRALYRNAFFDGIGRDINAWLHRWNGASNDGISLREAAETVRVANAVRKSFTSGAVVTL